ncbi:uncharacterized protein MONBRDRAFT_38899 [Monosiga brevicollis MX1]|uniref:Uncharacterized protein n=1 Tax=Monosiga brevicollis TaxID=81824 RepID=A9VAV2_MONBE|nr:uncharacterized protein MONBRDRAFT_38899 [Monosiga brevicollis MX1]EDQ85384.1 predicted protein [Monosiga brevicollis MX1]|eukprot:XP_001749795.1 hypothetical protein [Monosiga brevicollis MX1]
MAETCTFFQGDSTVVATVQSSLCYCDDTGAWREEVLLATQNGRKTTASRIGRHDGRLWNLPFPDGMEIARFGDDMPAIFAIPNEEKNLSNCPRLKLYRRRLMKHCEGVTFDLTKNKDLICALPYNTYGMDAIWRFLFCFKSEQGQLHWAVTKELFKLCKNSKTTTQRVRRDSTSSVVSSASSSSTPRRTTSRVKAEPTSDVISHYQQQQQQQQWSAMEDSFPAAPFAQPQQTFQQPQQHHATSYGPGMRVLRRGLPGVFVIDHVDAQTGTVYLQSRHGAHMVEPVDPTHIMPAGPAPPASLATNLNSFAHQHQDSLLDSMQHHHAGPVASSEFPDVPHHLLQPTLAQQQQHQHQQQLLLPNQQQLSHQLPMTGGFEQEEAFPGLMLEAPFDMPLDDGMDATEDLLPASPDIPIPSLPNMDGAYWNAEDSGDVDFDMMLPSLGMDNFASAVPSFLDEQYH